MCNMNIIINKMQDKLKKRRKILNKLILMKLLNIKNYLPEV